MREKLKKIFHQKYEPKHWLVALLLFGVECCFIPYSFFEAIYVAIIGIWTAYFLLIFIVPLSIAAVISLVLFATLSNLFMPRIAQYINLISLINICGIILLNFAIWVGILVLLGYIAVGVWW